MTPTTFTQGDVAAASRVLTATAEDRIRRGEELWTVASVSPERLGRHYPPEAWRVAWQGGEAVGCFVLLEADPLFWPDAREGAALLSEAVRETGARGLPFLRLDTATARPRLRAVYEDFGFRHTEDRVVKLWAVSLYEYPTGKLEEPASTRPSGPE